MGRGEEKKKKFARSLRGRFYKVFKTFNYNTKLSIFLGSPAELGQHRYLRPDALQSITGHNGHKRLRDRLGR